MTRDANSLENPPRNTDALELEDASGAIEALASSTARRILEAVHDQPGTATEIAERVDTSVQNASYHLANLCEADLLDAGRTRFAGENRPLDVYEPTDDPVVLMLGADEHGSTAVGTIQDAGSTV